MMLRILVCDPMPLEFFEALKAKGFSVDYVENPSPTLLCKLAREYDIIVVRGGTKVTAEVIEASPRLKLIARAGSGVDNIDVNTARKRGIRVINVPEAVANAVAELTIGLALALVRGIPWATETLRAGEWRKKEFVGREIAGMRVGVVGLGNVGSLVALKFKALGAKVIGYTRKIWKTARLGISAAKSLEELMEKSELVTLHVAYTPATRCMINESTLRLMPDSSYLINTSRAWIVDGKALLKALDDGVLAGAAVDVHYNEPPREEWEWKLIRHPKVIATPHIGAQTLEARRRLVKLLVEKIMDAARNF